MTSIAAETQWLRRLAPQLALRFLARLSALITIAGRNSYEAGTEQLSNPCQLRRVNEVQHRLTACVSQLIEGKCPAGFVESMPLTVLSSEDDELRQMLQWTWDEAKTYLLASDSVGLEPERKLKNIQVFDGANNAVFDIFAATEDEFALVFTNGADVAFIDEVYGQHPKAVLDAAFSAIWKRRVPKHQAMGIHGILFYNSEHKKVYYPSRRDEEAMNPDGSRLR